MHGIGEVFSRSRKKIEKIWKNGKRNYDASWSYISVLVHYFVTVFVSTEEDFEEREKSLQALKYLKRYKMP